MPLGAMPKNVLALLSCPPSLALPHRKRGEGNFRGFFLCQLPVTGRASRLSGNNRRERRTPCRSLLTTPISIAIRRTSSRSRRCPSSSARPASSRTMSPSSTDP
ncbi:hypothetical protein BOS5A_10576 [Bosea sp. EC-HK365B]|nr:hypothetical protein BOSE21B_10498 [Bosea sp. 21B]VVT44751.1 hypothetical protein BOS5A_10576 [Bosea sp. EC-HK365B]VXC49828.1 hypothetical protein BOSE127_190266 [Bosea sp. 127]